MSKQIVFKLEFCGCTDCVEYRDEPCAFDCDRDEECQGCFEARQGQEEDCFEIDCALGRV